ncbi:MAG: UvrD-helicase domain-containing protein, partial [Bdellovibrionaceae bacterium]|nr:UvrD-helicase domain-containing protein [Pseudobdellovibrionaceae bacterium]
PASEHMNTSSHSSLKDHVIVRAGAGAGKTRRLTLQVIEIAKSFRAREGRWPRMVVTTFTRKATQELRERLMLKALEDEPELIEFINSRSYLVVSTIHGVLDIYLKRYGGKISIDPGYAIMASGEADRLARQSLRAILVDDGRYADLLEVYGFNRLVSLARVYAEHIERVPEARPHDETTLRALFRERADALARDAEFVADDIEAESEKDTWRAMAGGFRRWAKVLREGEWESTREGLIAEVSATRAAPFSKKNPPVSEETNLAAKNIRERFKALSEDIYDPACWREIAAVFAKFEEMGRAFTRRYFAMKVERGSIEISDLEQLAMTCAREHPDSVHAFAQEWDYWLIDEYQDTSPFQVDLIRQFSGDRPNFIVGDPQQSIYLFRGARSEVFAEKEKEILGGGGSQDVLNRNYRSRPELLMFLNDVFARMDPPFRPMEPNLAEGESFDSSRVVAQILIAPDAAECSRTDGAEAQEQAVVPEEGALREPTASVSGAAGNQPGEPTADVELRSLVRHVQELLQAGAKYEDICVLARTNQTLLDVADWLDRFRLPTHVHAASGFYSRRETMDALALLKFLVNPHDNENLVLLLRSPWFRVCDATLTRLVRGPERSHWERLVGSLEDKHELEAVVRLRDWLAARAELGVGECFRRALGDAGFIDLSHLHDVSGRRESNVWKLLAKLTAAEGKPGFNYLSFIETSEVDLRDSSGAEESDAIAAVEPDRINLMTIHASKGLQFKHVLLPKMGQRPRLTASLNFAFDESRQLWALRVPRGDALEMTSSLAEKAWLETFRKQEQREHARVLYVALTRAIETVFMSWSGVPDPQSWAAALRLDLALGAHATPAYTYQVTNDLGEPFPLEAQAQDVIEPRAPWRMRGDGDAANGSRAESRIQESASVSQLLDRSAPLRRGWEALAVPARLKLAAQGTAVHRLMEALKSPAAGQIRSLIQRWFPDREEQVVRAVDYVSRLRIPPLADLIRDGQVEWGFAFLEKGVFVEGQIDLWGREAGADGSTVWVVDYKTGNPEGRAKAFEQLGLYALALRKAGQVRAGDRVRLAAVYPFAEENYLQDEPPPTFFQERFKTGPN